MKRDFLKNLGLEEEAIEKIMTEYGKDVTALKTDISNLKEDLAVKDGVIETKNTKIKELEQVDVEALKKEQFELGKTEGSKEVEKFKFDNALNDALKDAKVRDVKAISGFLDREKIKYEDGKIVGLEEQINPLKESHDFLFAGDEKAPQFASSTPGANKGATGLEDFMSVMGLKTEDKK